MAGEAKRLAAEVAAMRSERNMLRYRRKLLHRRLRNDLAAMVMLQKTWTPDNPINPYTAVAIALDALLVTEGANV